MCTSVLYRKVIYEALCYECVLDLWSYSFDDLRQREPNCNSGAASGTWGSNKHDLNGALVALACLQWKNSTKWHITT